MLILEEFKNLCAFYKKKHGRQASFRSMRMRSNGTGGKDPVFYVGGPGLMVAVALTIVTIATIYVLYLPFMWVVWVPYILAIFFMFRVALRLDRVRQVRHMVAYMINAALICFETAQSAETDDAKKEHLAKGEEWLLKADKWVEEPALTAQIDALKKSH